MKKTYLIILIALLVLPAVKATITAVTPNNPANNAWTSDNTPDFNFTAVSDINSSFSCELIVDSASNENSAASNNTATIITANPALLNGARNWNINCTDVNGTVSSASRTINIDAVSPVSTIDAPADNSWTTDTTPQITFTLTDNLDTVLDYVVFVDGSSDKTGTIANNTQTNVDLSALAQGQHTVKVEATDDVGNNVNSSALTINIDTTAPAVSSLNLPADNADLTNSNVVFNFTSYDNLDTTLDYTLFLDDVANKTGTTAGNNTSTQFTQAVSDGTYNWKIQVTDEAGNSANYSGSYSFTVDTGAPTVTNTSPNGTVSSRSVTLSATTNENAVCRYDTSDTVYASMTGNFTGTGTTHTKGLSLSNGAYLYYVRCNDSYGNVMSSSENINFTVSASSGGSGGSSNDDVEIDMEDDKKTVTLDKDETGKFKIKNENHEIKINTINGDKVSFTLYSKTVDFVLSVGETRKFDIDSNAADYDIAVTLEKIIGYSAKIILEEISEIVPGHTTPTTIVSQTQSAPQQDNQAVQQNTETPPQMPITGGAVSDTEQESGKSPVFWSTLLVAVAVAGIYMWKKH